MFSLKLKFLILMSAWFTSIPSIFYAAEMDSLVILESDKSVGSGFLLEEAGKVYVISNLHVIMGGKPKIQLLSGTVIEPLALEVAEDRDLGRMLIGEEGLKSLKIEIELPTVGQPIRVLGNSDGAGVATALEGKVLGVGPNLVEVDAEFVQGNSGSPITDSNGNVIGVASFATKNFEPKNWIKSDTRFNSVRRFGYRLNGVEWKNMSWTELGQRVRLLEDAERLCFQLFQLKYTTSFRGESGYLDFDLASAQKGYLEYTMFPAALNQIAEELNSASWAYGIRDDPFAQANRAMELTRSLRNSLGQAKNRSDTERARKSEYNRRLKAHRENINSLNSILYEDPEYFLNLRTVQRLGNGVRSRLVHDEWGSSFLKERANSIYELFLRVANGQILIDLKE